MERDDGNGVSEIMRLREQPCQAGGAVVPRERVCSEYGGGLVPSGTRADSYLSVACDIVKAGAGGGGKANPERVSF